MHEVVRHVFQRFDPERMFVHAGDSGVFLAARREKIFAAAHPDFLDGLQTIGHERWADHHHALLAFLRESGEFVVGVRFQPRVFAKARLERDRILFLRDASELYELARGGKTLRAITRRVSRAGDFAAVLHFKAMAACRVRLAQVPLRDSVIAEQQVIVILLE